MYKVHCTLYVVHCTLYVVHCIINTDMINNGITTYLFKLTYIVQCISLIIYIYNVCCIYHDVRRTECNVRIYIVYANYEQYTSYIVYCTLYSVQCTSYIVQCTSYSVQRTMYIVQRTHQHHVGSGKCSVGRMGQ